MMEVILLIMILGLQFQIMGLDSKNATTKIIGGLILLCGWILCILHNLKVI